MWTCETTAHSSLEPPDPSPSGPASPPTRSLPAPLAELEPALGDPNRPARFFAERSVDPRALSAAALAGRQAP